MVKRATQVEQDILDGAIERAVQDLASRSGKSAEEIRQMATTGAVYYTHLRAHETVLDLVCRLLLEKKKQTRPYSKSHTSI